MDPSRSLSQLMKESRKWTHNLSEEQVYSKLYYKDEIKLKYKEECMRLGLETTLKKECMTVCHQLTKEAWGKSSKDEQLQHKVLEEKA